MNIIVSNRFTSLLKTLNIEVIKELNGVYSADEIQRQLENIYYDKLIFDISALKDNQEIANIQKLSATLDMSKVILLIDDTKYFSTQEFISSIISIGIYNFTKNIEGVKYLLSHPNTYKDVMKYHKVEAVKVVKEEEKKSTEIPPRKYTSIEDIYASTVLTPAEKDELITKFRMQETVKKAKLGGENSTYVRKKNVVFKVLLSAFILPLMAFGLTYMYHFLLYYFGEWFAKDSAVGKAIFKESFKGGPTFATWLAIVALLLVMKGVYEIINLRIKANKSSCLKFSLIPFGVFTAIISFDKYIYKFLDGIIRVDNLETRSYMVNNIYDNFQLVCTLMVLVYFFGLISNRFRTIEFEQEISQRTSILEKIFSAVLIITVLLPATHDFLNIFTMLSGLTDFFNGIFKVNNLMLIITIIEIIGLIAVITVNIINHFRVSQMKTKKAN